MNTDHPLGAKSSALYVTERLSSSKWAAPWVKRGHFARYEWASQLAPGADVVDAACGSGYGSAVLARAGARAVCAVDASAAAISEADSYPPQTSVRYCVGDVCALPLSNESIDLYVSFETIEHLQDVEPYLLEAVRVLRPGGLFVCSTPNRHVTNPGTSITSRPYNPYHVREYSSEELQHVLSRHFEILEVKGQFFWKRPYVDALARSGRFKPLLAVRTHQMAKLLRVPFDRPAAHLPREFGAYDVPEGLVIVGRNLRTD